LKRGKMKKKIIGSSVVLMMVFSFHLFANKPLTFEERVKAQEAIERVYYNHRIWPKENPQPKPAFEKMVTKDQIEAKVTDYLKKSAALEKYWYRPIEANQLQAEMDRMAKGTKDPQTLNELFKALNDDPYLIAECLARPVLADRLIHNWYANDERFHGETRKKAEEALKTLTPENFCSYTEGQYSKMTYKLEMKNSEPEIERLDPEDHSIRLPEKEFAEMQSETPEEGKISGVIEKDDCFVILHTIEKNEGEMEVESFRFIKTDLADWLKKQSSAVVMSGTEILQKFSLPVMIDSSCAEDWNNGSLDDIPDARQFHSAVWTGTEMIVWGGSPKTNSGGRYNPATDSWMPTSLGTNVPSARYRHAAVWTGTEMIIWGGYDDSNFLNSGGRYNPESDSWTVTSTVAGVPSSRDYFTAVWTGTEMIVWGGRASGDVCFDTGGRYNPSADSWVATSTSGAPCGRRLHTAVWTGSVMIVWGGVYYDGLFHYCQTGGKYDPFNDSWTETSTGANCPSGRCAQTAVWTGTEMIVWGGTGGGISGGRYNPDSDTWLPTSTGENVPGGRANHTAIWTGTEMIVWGGIYYISDWDYYWDTGGRYNPETDAWTATSTGANTPTPKYQHTAVWTGSEMIIWGGGQEYYYENTGSRYNPTTGTWVPTSSSAYMPSARTDHTAVWTGTEMIVWGGDENGYYSNTGGKYCPSTDSWMETTTVGAPSWRCYHSAVWTGAEMIVWGGECIHCGDYLNTGGKYAPVPDTWTATSTASAPSGRRYHSAVWTGNEMIIWGGYYPDGTNYYLNTGGHYVPSSDSWTSTSLVSAPSARYKHTAVWTGNEMIIWGGYGSSPYYKQDGGRYNPSIDTWRETSTGIDCPLGREEHTAIWTGSEMIVWGGYTASSPHIVNTGGRYNPLNDEWRGTSTDADCPAARKLHSSVWTGSKMIIWGGYRADGGKYDPVSDSWSATSMINVPRSRWNHTSVWTGNAMIVWGGFSYPIYFQSGGAYYLPYSPSDWSNSTAFDKDECEKTGVLIEWTSPGNWGTENTGTRTFDVLRDGTSITPGLSESTLSFTDLTGANDVIYLYQVRATNGCGASITTAGVFAADYTGVAPSGFSNNSAYDISGCSNSGIRVEWTAPTNWGSGSTATRTYDVIRDGSVLASALSEATLFYTDASCTPGISYLYQIRANNGCGSSTTTTGISVSDISGVQPILSANNTASDVSTCNDSGVSIQWAAPSNWGDGGFGTRTFDVLRDGTSIASGLNGMTLSYTDSSGTNGLSYFYQIRANNGCGMSANTTGVSAADNVGTTPSFSNNTAHDVGCLDNGVSINWTPPSNWGDGGSGSRTFDILRDGSPIATSLSEPTLSYTDTTGDNGVSYLYQVRANNGCGISTTTAGATAMDFVCTWNILYSSHGSFTQLTGDGDSYFEKGELWSVPVTVTNSGNTPATNVTAVLSGNGITVCNSPGSFGTIAAGGTASFTFEFLISNTFTPCSGAVNFNLGSKTCVELTPAGSDESNLFSIQVGQVSAGVPTDLVLQPSTADSYVYQQTATTNYGTATLMYAQARTGQARRSLVQFDISSIPSGSTINSATLELYVTAVTGSQTLNVHRITGTWTETGVTWNTIPTFTSSADASITGGSGAGWRIWNVMPVVQGWANGTNTNYGFLVKCNLETGLTAITYTFATKEYATTSLHPILRINYTPATSWNCDYVGSGVCSVPLPGEAAPGDTYENGQMWSEDKNTQSWPELSGATGYQLYRGVQSGLPNLLTADNDSCLRYNGANTSINISSDDPSLETGSFYWYLVVGTNGSGDGTAGNARIVNSTGNCP
jgi:hypothetical protein